MYIIARVLPSLICLLLMVSSSTAHIWILDINDTITIRNDVDPQKTSEVVQRQLIAQHVFLKDRPSVSIETYIKETIKDKGEQRKAYGNLIEFAGELNRQGLLADQSLQAIPVLMDNYGKALEVANRKENSGFFPSLFKFIDYILSIDSDACISIQSFGEEIPLALKVIKERYGHKLKVQEDVAEFNNQNKLVYQGRVYESADDMLSLLKPGTVVGWKPNYSAGGGKCLFLNNNLYSFFFDDNANRFAKVYLNGQELSKEDGYVQAKDYIFQVDTAGALTDDDYFINLHKAYLANEQVE